MQLQRQPDPAKSDCRLCASSEPPDSGNQRGGSDSEKGFYDQSRLTLANIEVPAQLYLLTLKFKVESGCGYALCCGYKKGQPWLKVSVRLRDGAFSVRYADMQAVRLVVLRPVELLRQPALSGKSSRTPAHMMF